MPYIGNDIQYGELNSQTFTGDGSTTAFTLTYTVSNVNSLLVTVADVIQEPTTAYTVSGTTLTFTSAPANSDTIHVRYLGRTLDVGTTAIVQDSDQDTKIQVEESADEDTIRFDTGGTEIATATATSFNINNLVNTAASGIIESNANFVDTCLVGPSVDGKAWAGKFENGSVWSSLMLASVETSGANAEVNIWDLTDYTLTSATPLATVTLTGATPTSIAASMGYVIVGTSDQGIHIVDPHGGAWAERTVGWPRSLTVATTPNLRTDFINSVAASVQSSGPYDPRTGGTVPSFIVGYDGSGSYIGSLIKYDGTVWDKAGTYGNPGVAFIGDLVAIADNNSGDRVLLSAKPVAEITADGFSTGNVLGGSNNIPPSLAVTTGIDSDGSDSLVGFGSAGLTIAEVLRSSPTNFDNTMAALLTTTYNTGFLVGDIRLAALANSKTADRSYKANTLTENGTVTEAAVETGAEAKKYSGFSASNYLSRAYDADFDFGTGSLSILLWFYSAAVDSDQALVHRRDTGHAGAEIKLRVTSSGTVNFQLSGSGTATPTSAGAYDDGKWHLLVGTFDGTTTTLNIDGGSEVITSATAPGNLNNGTAVLRIGLSPNGNSPADDSAISLVRISASSLSSDQIKQIYEAEKGMFVANAKCLLQGAGNAVLDARVDPLTGKYIVTQSDTQDIFDGLTIETERTIAAGGTTFEHGLLWGDAVAEINDANLFASTPATDQRVVNEMVRSMSAELPAGVDLSKAKAWCYFYDSTISASHNIESITNHSTGQNTLTFAVPFKSANYVVALSSDGSTTTTLLFTIHTVNQAAGSIRFEARDSASGTITTNNANVGVVFFGELENE